MHFTVQRVTHTTHTFHNSRHTRTHTHAQRHFGLICGSSSRAGPWRWVERVAGMHARPCHSLILGRIGTLHALQRVSKGACLLLRSAALERFPASTLYQAHMHAVSPDKRLHITALAFDSHEKTKTKTEKKRTIPRWQWKNWTTQRWNEVRGKQTEDAKATCPALGPHANRQHFRLHHARDGPENTRRASDVFGWTSGAQYDAGMWPFQCHRWSQGHAGPCGRLARL